MNITTEYTAYGSILATIDGQQMSVPDDMDNRHRRMIAEWEAEGNTIAAYVPPGPTALDVVTERDRRLGAGFDFDFGDVHGVHHIGTTADDMIGWNEVTTWATVQNATGNTTATLSILTDTGPTVVTPGEWFAILNAATAFRQPIWGMSFTISNMDPIPPDYTNDSYWSL